MHIAHRSSIVTELAGLLRRDVQAGTWREFLPGERELCGRCQVSRPTLRKALAMLREEGWISSRQGQGWRVAGKAHRGGTVDVRPKTVNLLCFVPLHEAASITLYVINKLQEHLTDAGITAHVHAGSQYNSQNYAQNLERLLRSSPADAWVLYGSPERIERWFLDRRIRFFAALSLHKVTRYPSLWLDVVSVYRYAATTLLHRGHRHIGFLVPRRTAASERSQGGRALSEERMIATALEGCGSFGDFAHRVIFHEGNPNSVQETMSAVFRESRNPPTGLVVLRPQHSLTALTCLLSMGKRVPHDVSVIGIGHESYLDHVRPRIAHFALDRRAYVARLCRLVIPWAMTGHWTVEKTEVQMRYFPGDTVASR